MAACAALCRNFSCNTIGQLIWIKFTSEPYWSKPDQFNPLHCSPSYIHKFLSFNAARLAPRHSAWTWKDFHGTWKKRWISKHEKQNFSAYSRSALQLSGLCWLSARWCVLRRIFCRTWRWTRCTCWMTSIRIRWARSITERTCPHHQRPNSLCWDRKI